MIVTRFEATVILVITRSLKCSWCSHQCDIVKYQPIVFFTYFMISEDTPRFLLAILGWLSATRPDKSCAGTSRFCSIGKYYPQSIHFDPEDEDSILT
jgi:hypothetical protein